MQRKPQHAKSCNAVADTTWLTLAVAFLTVSWRVSTGRHAWRPLPEIDMGATQEFAVQLHGWNQDPATERFEPVLWPPNRGDLAAPRPEVRA